MPKYIGSALKRPPAGVLWASWRIYRCIALGIHNHHLFSAFPSASISAFSSSSISFALTVISTSSTFFFFALAFLSPCFFSKSQCNHSTPLSSKLNCCVDTHNLHSFADAVDRRGWGHRLARGHAIGPNHSSSLIPSLMSSIHSLATVTTSAMKFHHSNRDSRW